MALSPALIHVEQAAALAAETAGVDLAYITPEAAFAAVTYPRRVLTAPQMEMLPVEVISAGGKKELGIDPLDVESIMVIVEPPVAGPPGYGAVVRLSKPHQLDGLLAPLVEGTTEGELNGKPYRQAQAPMFPSIYMPDDRTLIVAEDAFLRKMLANHQAPAEGPLGKLFGSTSTSGDLVAIAVLDPVRDLLSAMLAQAPVPPTFEKVKRVPELLKAAKAELGLTERTSASLVLLTPSEAAAEELEQLINEMIDSARQMILAEMAQATSGDDPVNQAMAQYMQRVNKRIFDMLRPVRKGTMLSVSQDTKESSQVAVIGILVALLLPAVQAAREAARRSQSVNNMKQIGLAMHNYHDAYKRFPARAGFDDGGKPLLSWRVQVLPFIGQQPLYEQFHLDEPWDSEHNKTLIPLMPQVYRNPSSGPDPSLATYVVPTGEGTIFDGQEGTKLAEITDGTSATVMVIEVDPDAAVTWTKPDDWEYHADNPLAGLGNAHPGGFNVLLADGSVHFISAAVDKTMFRALLTKSGGDKVGPF
jgi:prepilin-type processing-associated H-X9-DG protein